MKLAGFIVKASFFLDQAQQRFRQSTRCPNCNYDKSSVLDRKYLVSELRCCQKCRLMYRFPLDDAENSRTFYQHEYHQGFTTEAPDVNTLSCLTASSFAGTEKDYSSLIAIISDLGVVQGSRIFDFGCSWGYGSWQLSRAGYNVEAFEISQPRARYARELLGVNVIDRMDMLSDCSKAESCYDLFFSNHVLEHVPSPSSVVRIARRMLKPGGLFIAVTPNGSDAYRQLSPTGWHRSWGKVHPNLLSETFWMKEFQSEPYFVGSLPDSRDKFREWALSPVQIVGSMHGCELICVAQL